MSTISFEAITTDFRSIIERRRKQLAFLFSTGAAFAILADGVFHGRTPSALEIAPNSLILAGTAAMMLIAFVTALREARLHRGIAYNGELYHSFKTDGTVTGETHSRRLKLFGVSSALFAIALVTGVALEIFLSFALGASNLWAFVIGAISTGLMAVGLRFQHRRGIELADSRRADLQELIIPSEKIHRHIALSIDDAHRDMLELLSLVGLAAFCAFQLLSGIGEASFDTIGAISMSTIHAHAVSALSSFLLLITSIAICSYAHLRYRVGALSTIQDPNENAFKLLSIDDSFFGLLILAALLWFELTLFFSSVTIAFVQTHRGSIALVCAVLTICAERLYLWQNGRRQQF